MLEKELGRIVALMPQLGIRKVVLTGSHARGSINPGSDLNFVIVQESARGYQYGRREDFFSYHLNPEVAMDYVVYTPEEFEEESLTNPSLRYALERGRVVYESEPTS
jgi:predicted nucleotidyltransferase